MIGNTRAGLATFDATSSNVDQIVKQFDLKRVDNADPPSNIRVRYGKGCNACEGLMDRYSLHVYVHSHRVALSSGRAFTSIYLFYNPSSKKACVEMMYAYS
jgi:hypothetical protein